MARGTAVAERPVTTVLTLRPEPISVPLARRRVAAFGRKRLSRDRLDVVLLLTSEVVTNAVLHAGGLIELRVTLERGLVRVEVRDCSGEHPVRRSPEPEELGGRGVQLLDALASAWGTRVEGGGKTVWFEVAAS